MINNISMHFFMSFLPFSSGLFQYVVPVPLWFFVMILASFVPVPRFSVRHPLNPKTRNQYSAPAERLLFFPCGRLALCKSNYLFPARNEEHVYVWFVSFLSAVLPQSCNDFLGNTSYCIIGIFACCLRDVISWCFASKNVF